MYERRFRTSFILSMISFSPASSAPANPARHPNRTRRARVPGPRPRATIQTCAARLRVLRAGRPCRAVPPEARASRNSSSDSFSSNTSSSNSGGACCFFWPSLRIPARPSRYSTRRPDRAACGRRRSTAKNVPARAGVRFRRRARNDRDAASRRANETAAPAWSRSIVSFRGRPKKAKKSAPGGQRLNFPARGAKMRSAGWRGAIPASRGGGDSCGWRAHEMDSVAVAGGTGFSLWGLVPGGLNSTG